MPKVKEEYLQKKNNLILDAAFKVCMEKPMAEVSMRDIISESGLSQGGIYRYYSNIDEVFVALINRENSESDVKTLVDTATSSDQAPEEIIRRLMFVWKQTILDSLIGAGKIYYELCALYISDEARLNNFVSKTSNHEKERFIQEQSFLFIGKKIAEGYFKPRLPMDDVATFLVTSLDGIIRDLILNNHYRIKGTSFSGELDAERLIQSLCMAFVMLLGGDVDKICWRTAL